MIIKSILSLDENSHIDVQFYAKDIHSGIIFKYDGNDVDTANHLCDIFFELIIEDRMGGMNKIQQQERLLDYIYYFKGASKGYVSESTISKSNATFTVGKDMSGYIKINAEL